MRNRTELVTTNLAESDNEEDQSVDDNSEEDWKPEKKKGAGKSVTKTPAKRKSGGSASRSRTGKKPKKEESEEEEDEEDEDNEEDEESENEEDEEDDSDDGGSAKGKKSTDGKKKSRSSVSVGKNQPDKDGNMELYLFKNDLTKDFRNDEKLCMWRRDGASLLQKYLSVPEDSQGTDIIFKASSVYSCWEEKRKNDFFQIKVQLFGDKKEGKVRVVDVAEFEKYALEDRPKVDLTPKGAEGGADNSGQNEEDEEDEDGFDENEEDEEEE